MNLKIRREKKEGEFFFFFLNFIAKRNAYHKTLVLIIDLKVLIKDLKLRFGSDDFAGNLCEFNTNFHT